MVGVGTVGGSQLRVHRAPASAQRRCELLERRLMLGQSSRALLSLETPFPLPTLLTVAQHPVFKEC